jgi:predicted NUDIX family NTP pyrophosphohydrolase
VTRGKFGAGLLMFKRCDGQVLLVHPGGPFWKKKDEGAWSIPKGECEEGEDPLDAAKREGANAVHALRRVYCFWGPCCK